jgi:hypothetical protein
MAVAAVGLSHGPVHAEFRLNERGVWPIEIAPRPIGGLCARSLRFVSRSANEWIGLEELLLRFAADLPVADYSRESQASGVMMIPVPRSGIYEGVGGVDAARTVQNVTKVVITAREHDSIRAWPDGSSYLGFIFARAEKPEEAEAALRIAQAKLNFRIASPLPVSHPVTGQINTVDN